MIDMAETIRAAGGPSRIAAQLGVSHSTVIDWRKAGRVPVERVKAFGALTGLAPHELRPDIFDPPEGAAS
jgi:DNA-binding transcriptional regulator YdaS (Cro superfamily)